MSNLKSGKRSVFWIVLIVILAALPPVLHLWLSGGRGPVITPERLREALGTEDGIVVVDVRTREEYLQGSVTQALNLPLSDFEKLSKDAWTSLVGNPQSVVLVCNVGVRSALAEKQLLKIGVTNAWSLEGGLDSWYRTMTDDPAYVPRLKFSLFEQWAISISAFGLKPLYEILALAVAIVLWRRKEMDMVLLKWSMIAFFLGENACAVNYLFFGERSMLWEYFHCLGMLLAVGLGCYAVMHALDTRFVKFSDRNGRCAMLSVCGQCYKHQEVACRLRLFFMFVIVACMAMAGMLLSAPLDKMVCIGEVLGGDVTFAHTRLFQNFEVRFCPLLALPFLLGALVELWRKKEDGFQRAKALLAVALGPLLFGMMRFIIFWTFRDRLILADLWEELSELFLILGVIWTLYVFRRSVFGHMSGGL